MASGITAHKDADLARKFADAFRSGMTAEDYVAYRAAVIEIDVRDMLPEIRAPTLVVHDSSFAATRVGEVVQRLARLIPHARFVETSDLATVADEFLREGGLVPLPASERASPTARPGLRSGMTAILFADIVDSTALTERLGDAAFRAKARDLDTTLRAIIRDNAGTPIEGKLLGDGVLAVFTSARQAIEAALACGRAGDEGGLPLHLGLHAGDVIREADADGRANVYGGAVNIASRISGLSAPGEVLVSETVRSLARTSAGVSFEDRGEQALKGVGEEVRVWAVVAQP
jgi:class 3 adenylate cyclase